AGGSGRRRARPRDPARPGRRSRGRAAAAPQGRHARAAPRGGGAPMRTHAGMAAVLALACASCGTDERLAECPGMPVKGWIALPQAKEFAPLSHRKDTIYEPLSESSQILWADSNYTYEALLTFELAYP